MEKNVPLMQDYCDDVRRGHGEHQWTLLPTAYYPDPIVGDFVFVADETIVPLTIPLLYDVACNPQLPYLHYYSDVTILGGVLVNKLMPFSQDCNPQLYSYYALFDLGPFRVEFAYNAADTGATFWNKAETPYDLVLGYVFVTENTGVLSYGGEQFVSNGRKTVETLDGGPV